MDDIPSIHRCCQLYGENDKLRRKISLLRKKNCELVNELDRYKQKEEKDSFMKQYVTTRTSQTQTDSSAYGRSQPSVSNISQVMINRSKSALESERINKLMDMHNNLMKRYEKELKLNVQNTDTITTLSLRVNELEQKLTVADVKGQQLDLQNKKLKVVLKADGRDDLDDLDMSGLLQEIRHIRKERDKLLQERNMFREELKGLDKDFFDEIEDIKYALHQSAQLNKAYEKALRQMCSRFDVPFPAVCNRS